MTKTARKAHSPNLNPESEWFGFRRVRPQEKAGLVRDVFDSVAENYDLMNDLMSGGLHRLWKDRLASMMNPKAGQNLLDVAGGTGDVAYRCYKRTEGKAHITVCDINTNMLKHGRARMIDRGILSTSDNTIRFITGNAEELPIPARSVDIYSIAFGLRNVTHIDKALSEAVRVLRPGGRFFCLEFSPGVNPLMKPIYDRYCTEVLPRLGAMVAHDRDSYQYLAESILKFPPQGELAKRMEKAGMTNVSWINLTGGIAVIHVGWKL
jgi:demethylmenaquinone methyltransferase/2-methoxy-6-polyprenyl-1,4-benzoquinol methylase